jgi:hypothetical protein
MFWLAHALEGTSGSSKNATRLVSVTLCARFINTYAIREDHGQLGLRYPEAILQRDTILNALLAAAVQFTVAEPKDRGAARAVAREAKRAY